MLADRVSLISISVFLRVFVSWVGQNLTSESARELCYHHCVYVCCVTVWVCVKCVYNCECDGVCVV